MHDPREGLEIGRALKDQEISIFKIVKIHLQNTE